MIVKAFKNEGIEFAEIVIDKSLPQENLPTRKPGTAQLTHYIKGNYNLAESYVIGDRLTDAQLAKNLGCKSIYMGTESCKDSVSWEYGFNGKSRGRSSH